MPVKEEKAKLTLKPHLTNALIPLFLKNLTYTITITFILLFVTIILEKLNIFTLNNKFLWTIILIILLTTISIIFKAMTLNSTNYHLYKTHLIKEYKLINIKKEYVPYSQIANITVEISLWDRICNAGDIRIHTSDDSVDIILNFIENPQEIEKKIYTLVNKAKGTPKAAKKAN